MKNFCISYELYQVFSDGREFPVRRAFTKSTLFKFAAKLGLSNFCIVTYHTSNLVSSVFKKEYYND